MHIVSVEPIIVQIVPKNDTCMYTKMDRSLKLVASNLERGQKNGSDIDAYSAFSCVTFGSSVIALTEIYF